MITLAAVVAISSSSVHLHTASVTEPPESTVRLQLNLEPEETYYQRSVIRQRIVLGDEEDEQITESIIGTGMKYKVLRRDNDGVHKLRVTYDWVRISTRLDGERIDYDSSKSIVPEAPGAVQYAAQVGQTFVLTMAADGRILSFEGLPAMHERMAQRITELGGRGRAHLPAIRQQFGEQSLRDGLSLFETVLPDSTVQVGETWSHTSNNTAGFAREVDATYRLAEVKNGIALIEADVTIRPSTRDEDDGAKSIARQWLEIEGADTGFYRVDLATGWIVEAKTEQTMAGTSHSQRGDEEAVANISITGTTRLTSSNATPTDK